MDLIEQLEGALHISEGRDFEIRADFVREVIAALRARADAPLGALREVRFVGGRIIVRVIGDGYLEVTKGSADNGPY